MIKKGLVLFVVVLLVGVAWFYVTKDESSLHSAGRKNPAKEKTTQQPKLTANSVNREAISKETLLSIQQTLPAGPFLDRFNALSPEAQERVLIKIWKSPAITNNVDEIRIGNLGELYYVCKGMCKHKMVGKSQSLQIHTNQVETQLNQYSQSVPVTSPPMLSSRPNSQNTIYLDFNGMIVSNTFWNYDYGVSSWDTPAFSRDGDEDTFSPYEQAEIERIWRSVVAKFESFDVNITTVDPGSNPYFYHLLITSSYDKNNTATPLLGSGGIAILGDPYIKLRDFPLGNIRYYSPAWVQGEAGFSAEDIAMICAHEAGHNLGLNHDGTSADEYYDGHYGSPSWGPIMGSPYNRNVTSWSKGEYTGANNTFEDDLDVIAYQFSYLSDEVGSQFETAKPLQPASNGSLNYEGMIERQSDVDIFEVEILNAGQVDIKVYPSTNAVYELFFQDWRSMLKLEMQVFDDQGVLLSSGQVENRLHAEVTLSLTAGTYYIKLEGVGTGTPLASTPNGFTDYGSIGAYYLSGNMPAPDDLDGDDLPDTWEIEQFGSAAALPSDDPDGDGADNLSEYIAGTDPNDDQSTFSISGFWVDEAGSHLTWNSVEGRSYQVQMSTAPATNTFLPISAPLIYPLDRFTDTVERAESTLFYRLEVDMP